MTVVRLSETHRRTLGSRLAEMRNLIAEVRGVGFESGLLTELEAELARIDLETDAIRPRPAAHRARAALAQLLLLALEIRPRALRAYGELAEEGARYLEQRSARLSDIVERALDELEGQSEQEVISGAVQEDPGRDRR